MLRPLLLLVLLGSGCATINTSGMSEHCRRMYDACLNTCPTAEASRTGQPQLNQWRTDVASCTDDCNKKARKCE